MQHALFKMSQMTHVLWMETAILDGNSRRSKSELPSTGDPFLAPKFKVADITFFIFFTLYSLIWLLESKFLFREYLMPSPVTKDARL